MRVYMYLKHYLDLFTGRTRREDLADVGILALLHLRHILCGLNRSYIGWWWCEKCLVLLENQCPVDVVYASLNLSCRTELRSYLNGGRGGLQTKHWWFRSVGAGPSSCSHHDCILSACPPLSSITSDVASCAAKAKTCCPHDYLGLPQCPRHY